MTNRGGTRGYRPVERETKITVVRQRDLVYYVQYSVEQTDVFLRVHGIGFFVSLSFNMCIQSTKLIAPVFPLPDYFWRTLFSATK